MPTIQWTKDEKPIGEPVVPPPEANDYSITLHRCIIWTRDDRPLGNPVPSPHGTTDVRFLS